MEIKVGLSEKNIDQLIEYTNSDDKVAKYTSDRERFSSRESYGVWLKKGRILYSLVDENGDLMGITWFGYEGEGFSVAIRIYGSARGKGLAEEFLRETMNQFRQNPAYLKSNNKSWWLKVSEDNVAARRVYEKLGFQLKGNWNEPGKLFYTLEK